MFSHVPELELRHLREGPAACLAAVNSILMYLLVVEDITSLALIGFHFHTCLSILIEMKQSYRALVSTGLMGSLCWFEKSTPWATCDCTLLHGRFHVQLPSSDWSWHLHFLVLSFA
jgi:hypothetical protein